MILKNCRGEKIKLKQTQIVRSHFQNNSSYAGVVLNQINNDGIYQKFFDNILDNACIIDVGANIGLFSLYSGAKTGYNVYSYEPTPGHFEVLKELTSQYKNIRINQNAVSNNSGETNFYINDENSTMNSLNNIYGESLKVQCIGLDEVVKDVGFVDFIKIDIEGGEMIALTTEILNKIKDNVGMWFIEVHATAGTSIEENRLELLKRFHSCGIPVESHAIDIIQSRF